MREVRGHDVTEANIRREVRSFVSFVSSIIQLHVLRKHISRW
jgi:hypothetical protein